MVDPDAPQECLHDFYAELRPYKKARGRRNQMLLWPHCKLCDTWSGGGHLIGKTHRKNLSKIDPNTQVVSQDPYTEPTQPQEGPSESPPLLPQADDDERWGSWTDSGKRQFLNQAPQPKAAPPYQKELEQAYQAGSLSTTQEGHLPTSETVDQQDGGQTRPHLPSASTDSESADSHGDILAHRDAYSTPLLSWKMGQQQHHRFCNLFNLDESALETADMPYKTWWKRWMPIARQPSGTNNCRH